MKYVLIICAIYFVTCCKNTGNKNGIPPRSDSGLVQYLDFGSFQIKTPKKWKILKFQGIDSYVGGLTNGIDTLEFDYGRYSNELKDDCEKQLYAYDTINGKAGYITKPKIKSEGLWGVYFGNIDKERFNLCARNVKDENSILLIFQHIKFKTNDTTKNSTMLKFESWNCN